MGIIVQESQDADILRACEIEAAAYASNAASPILFPGPFPAGQQQRRAEHIINMRKTDPTSLLINAVDEASGEMVAFAKWNLYQSAEAAAAAPTRQIPSGPGVNADACEAFFGGLLKKKAQIMGSRPKAYMYLQLLHTDPKHQGRGAGALLLNWGLQKADELGLPTYLESSPDAHGFYLKHGFKDIEIFSVDLTRFGGKGVHIAPLMIREPIAST